MTIEEAQGIAVGALGFVAGDDVLLPRFLALTGIEANRIRLAAIEPGFLAGVLRFVSAHEPTLMRFAAAADIEPGRVAEALRSLPGGDEAFERST